MSYFFRRPWGYMVSRPSGARPTNFIGTTAVVVTVSLVYNLSQRYQHILNG